MASLSSDRNGNRTIQFVAGDGKRRTIRLGKVSKRLAEGVKLRVEALNSALIARLPLDGETAAWVAGVGDDLAAKLAAVGLVPARRSETLKAFLDAYLEERRHDSKPATVVTISQVARDLLNHFGTDTDLRGVTVAGANQFKQTYLAGGKAQATTYRRLKMCKMLFKVAHTRELIPTNPFQDVTSKNSTNPDRRVYVPVEDALKLIGAANPCWRVIVALARLGGLRCPSEVLSLRWADVDLAAGRMTVTAPKTEHLDGRGYRVVPVFAALRPHLEDAWELAAPGEVHVVGGPQGDRYRAAANGRNGWVGCNVREPFLKLIRRAGLTPWPKVFQNLRASCETDLMQHHPIHVVTAWMGNTPRIALSHYLQTLDRDFEKAVRGAAESGADALQKAVQPGAAPTGQEGKGETVPSERVGVRVPGSTPGPYCPDDQMAKVGLEPPPLLPCIPMGSVITPLLGAAQSGAVAGDGVGLATDELIRFLDLVKALKQDQLSIILSLIHSLLTPQAGEVPVSRAPDA